MIMNRGFIRNIIIIVGALVALKYFFHFDLIDFIAKINYREVLEWLKINIWQHIYDFFQNLKK